MRMRSSPTRALKSVAAGAVLMSSAAGGPVSRAAAPVIDHSPTWVAQRAELRRIVDAGYRAGLSVGSVHVYILSPEGHTIDSMHTAQAAQADRLIGLLERTVQRLGPIPGGPVVRPAVPAPPNPGPDG